MSQSDARPSGELIRTERDDQGLELSIKCARVCDPATGPLQTFSTARRASNCRDRGPHMIICVGAPMTDGIGTRLSDHPLINATIESNGHDRPDAGNSDSKSVPTRNKTDETSCRLGMSCCIINFCLIISRPEESANPSQVHERQ